MIFLLLAPQILLSALAILRSLWPFVTVLVYLSTPGKCVGPSSVLTVLGIELDSDLQMARLPEDKLQTLQGLVHSWLPRKLCFRQELESFMGHLHHAAKVVWPGRTFLRRMIDLLCCFRRKDHPIRLRWLNTVLRAVSGNSREGKCFN